MALITDQEDYYVGEEDSSPRPSGEDRMSSFVASRDQRRMDKLTSDINSLQEEIERQRSKNLEILAIFGALFTFISIQLQQLANSNKVISVFIGLISLGGLLLFASILIIASSLSDWRKILVSSACLVLSIIILTFGWAHFNTYLGKQDYCSFLSERRDLTKDSKIKEQLQQKIDVNCSL